MADLIRWTGYRRQIIDKSLRRMLAEGRIHVSGHQRYEVTGSGMARQFSVGEGVNKPRPRVPKHQQYEAHREKSKYRQRRLRTQRAGQEFGPLAHIATQIRQAT